MPDGVSFDFSELETLAADIGRVAVDSARNVHKAIEVTARHVKDDTKKSVGEGSRTWRGLVGAVDYDVRDDPGAVVAEVGYKHGRHEPGNLGNIREYGAPAARRTVVGSDEGKPVIIPTKGLLARPPHSDLKNALKQNEGDFEKGISMAIDSVLEENGL